MRSNLITQHFADTYGIDIQPPYGVFATAVASGVSGAFGSAVQFVASTPYDAFGLILSSYAYGTANNGLQVSEIQVMVGGAGSEQPIATVGVGGYVWGGFYFVPIFIPAGSRVSLSAAAADTVSSNIRCAVGLCRGKSTNPLVSNGRIVGVSAGAWTQVNSGPATAGSMSPWAQITASTPNDARGYSLSLAKYNNIGSSGPFVAEMAIGGAGSEVIVLSPVTGFIQGYTSSVNPGVIGPIWQPIPAGSRIAVRCGSDGAVDNTSIVSCLTLWE